jgi:ADP-L-glycero-D-manno-heptose 6-epimerase
VDRLSRDSRWQNLVPLAFDDYMDADDFLQRIGSKPEGFGQTGFVFHFGACSSTTEDDAGYLMRNNFSYSRELANWAVGHRIRFVYASSAATYGDGSHGMSDEMLDLHRLRPLNMYGYSKHLFDCWTKQRGIARGVLGLKFFNVFGPNEGDMRSVVHKAYHEIRETGALRLFRSRHPDYADGEQRRDFLYVKDAVDMTLHLAGLPVCGGIHNVGSGVASTWLDLARAVFDALGRQPQIEFIDMPETLHARYQYFTQADIRKLLAAGYQQPIMPLRDAVLDYVRNYLQPGHHLGDEPSASAPPARRTVLPGGLPGIK